MASSDPLAEVHALLADHFLDLIKEAKASGEAMKPAMYAAMIKFLKDNGIDSIPVAGSPLEQLGKEAAVLPFPTKNVKKA